MQGPWTGLAKRQPFGDASPPTEACIAQELARLRAMNFFLFARDSVKGGSDQYGVHQLPFHASQNKKCGKNHGIELDGCSLLTRPIIG